MEKDQKTIRKPLRAVVAETDQEILRLLMRRSNLLAKMRVNGRLPASDEKFLREAWQNDVARVSHDPELSGRFFTLMQQVTFLPKPCAQKEADALPGSQRRDAFNLAPPKRPVNIALTAPLSGWQTSAWLYLASQAGQSLRLAPCLQNDELVDLVKSLAQMGAGITREDDAILCRSATPLATPDKVLHAGSSELNFFIILAHYLGHHSRVKITGESSLQLADFTALRNFLPTLGARMVNIVPRSAGLPARIESSGQLPPGIRAPADLPVNFIEALLLAAPGYQAPFAVDLSLRPDSQRILAHIMPLLESCGAIFALSDSTLSIEPSGLAIPNAPALAVEQEVAAFLLAFAAALGGKVKLKGQWPTWPDAVLFWEQIAKKGFLASPAALEANFVKPIPSITWQEAGSLSEWQIAFMTSLAACVCLNNGQADLPIQFRENEHVQDFLRVAGLAILEDGSLKAGDTYDGMAWNAPTPAWAFALALAASCRKGRAGWPLGNPGIVTELWPPFWSIYNGLPEPMLKRAPEAKTPEKQARRRIITNVVATVPEIREEDLD